MAVNLKNTHYMPVDMDIKCKVVLSNGSVTFSCLLIVGLGVLSYLFFTHGELWAAVVAAAALLALVAGALLYAPAYIGLDGDTLVIGHPLRVRRLPVGEIADVRVCPPTMGARRLFGSGGFLGYWGVFSERDLGRYTAFHGRASDCFLVTLRDGRKFLLGCEDYPAMVSSIKSRMAEAVPA